MPVWVVACGGKARRRGDKSALDDTTVPGVENRVAAIVLRCIDSCMMFTRSRHRGEGRKHQGEDEDEDAHGESRLAPPRQRRNARFRQSNSLRTSSPAAKLATARPPKAITRALSPSMVTAPWLVRVSNRPRDEAG